MRRCRNRAHIWAISCLFLLVIVLPILTASCVSKEVAVTETYNETAYRNESYTESGNEHRQYINTKWYRKAPLAFNELEWSKAGAESHLHGYEINTAKLSKSQVRLIFSDISQVYPWGILAIDLTGIGPISAPPPQSALSREKVVDGEIVYIPTLQEQIWLNEFNAITTDPERLLLFTSSDQYTGRDITFYVTGVEEFVVMACTSSFAGSVIEKAELIWSDEVTRERQIPYQVEKQRTVMQTIKVPFWEAIFD